MRRHHVWVIEDKLAEPVERVLRRDAEPYLRFEVFPTPDEAREALVAAATADDIPDVALVDVNFDSRSSGEIFASVDPRMRGFVIAAEVLHFARELRKPALRYRIYTGNKTVRDEYRWLYTNPWGHEPLLPISEKAGIIEPFHILDWMRQELRLLTRYRIQHEGLDCLELCAFLDPIAIEMERAWYPQREAVSASFEAEIRPAVVDFLNVWERSSQEPRFAKDYVPVGRLRHASSVGAVIDAIGKSEGAVVNGLLGELQERVESFSEEYGGGSTAARALAHRRAKALAQDPHFKTIIAPLFPFEAREIEESSDPETIINALRSILGVLEGAGDHLLATMRTLKSLRGTRLNEDPTPTTVFAHAYHNMVYWDQAGYPFPQPSRPDELEALLREELGLDEVEDEARRVPRVHLPHRTIAHLLEDGRATADGSDFHLVRFCEASPRAHWQEHPAEYFRNRWGGSVICEPANFAPDEPSRPNAAQVVCDWRLICEIIEATMAAVPVQGPPAVLVRYKDDGKDVTIDFDFPLRDGVFLGRQDLREGAGTLTRELRALRGWGKFTVLTNSKNTCWSIAWPGGEPEELSGDTSRGQFLLRWQLRNHYAARGEGRAE